MGFRVPKPQSLKGSSDQEKKVTGLTGRVGASEELLAWEGGGGGGGRGEGGV